MTKTKDVQGLHFTRNAFVPCMITVRVTSDEHGKSLSLADEKLGVMLEIPLEPLEDVLKVEGETDE